MNVAAETPMIGKTDLKTFWLVFLAGMFLLSGLLVMVSQGAVAMAAAIPVPFSVQASTLNGSNFKLYPGLSQVDNASPVGVSQMDCTINSLVISKKLPVPMVGDVSINLGAGKNIPVSINGLTIDMASFGVDEAKFSNLLLSSGGQGMDLNAPKTTLNNANINSPYLIASNITLPNLTLTINH